MQISENTTVEKLVAKAGERERVLSSYEEYLGFIEEADTLNEFDDPDVIAVKFIFTEEETEETCWYLNPGFTSPYMKEHEHDVFLCNDLQFVFVEKLIVALLDKDTAGYLLNIKLSFVFGFYIVKCH